MPAKKQPQSLTKLCTRQAANVAECACITIEKQHGDYTNSNCRKEINIIRNYFLEHIGHRFEKVCAELNRARLTFRFPKDLRIIVDFTFHENKQMISLPVLLHQDISVHLTSIFVAEKLCTMKRIKNLDISEINCSDEIIKVISDNCKDLEHFHIAVSSDAVSDDGPLLLKKCPELRIIIDFSQFTDCTVSRNTIRSLVIGLPRLIAINYLHMGAVLSSGFENMTLPLRSVCEFKADAEHVESIVKLCPNLERLALAKNVTRSEEILNSLTVSNLKVYTLDLSYFPFAHVAPLLREKGKYLRTLRLFYPSNYNAKEDITLIGINCPFLEHLTWATNGSKIGHISVDHPFKMSKQEEQTIFSNLNTLKLFIHASDFDLGIPQLCLLNASNIKDIVLIANDPTDTNADLNRILSEILLKNRMTHLKNLRIRGAYFLDSSTKAFELIFNCLNNLKQFLYISKMNAEIVDYFKLMESKILENNLQLRLVWRNLTDGSFPSGMQDIEGFEESDEDDEDFDENWQEIEGINGDGEVDDGDDSENDDDEYQHFEQDLLFDWLE